MALRELIARARAAAHTGRPAAAAPLIEEALTKARTLDSPPLLAEVLVLAAKNDQTGEHPERALERGREALTVAVADGDSTHASAAALILVQTLAVHPDGASHSDLLALAEALCRNAGEPSDLKVELLLTQANHLLDAGRYVEALEPFERARDLALAAGHPRAAALALIDLGNGRGANGDQEGSIAAYKQALAELEPLAGEMHPFFANIHANIGAARVEIGEHNAALEAFARAMEIAAANFPDDDNRVSAAVLSNIALSYSREGLPDEALAAYKEALAVNERVYGASHYYVANVLVNMARLLDDLGRLDEGLAAAERATAIQREVLPPGHCEVLVGRRVHAGLLRQLDRRAEAVQLLEPLFEHFAASECPPPMIGQIELEVARSLALHPGQDEARALALLDAAAGKLRGRNDRLRSALR
jgi:tetratricopeptide (TPR) repeat protein